MIRLINSRLCLGGPFYKQNMGKLGKGNQHITQDNFKGDEKYDLLLDILMLRKFSDDF